MEEEIKKALNINELRKTGKGGGGCINLGECYETENGLVYVKYNSKPEAFGMFEGEFESLKAIQATNTVRVPKPMKVIKNPKGGAVLIMEYLEMSHFTRRSEGDLGKQLAALHSHNHILLDEANNRDSRVGSNEKMGNYPEPITQFGFHCNTSCGFLPQNNSWNENWVQFYTKQKLEYQVNRIVEKYGEVELSQYWPMIESKIPELFKDIVVKPSLLHGDLWSGNAAENADGPVIFDPASFYGHSEYDLAIAKIFGGFGLPFFSAYHACIPKQPGFELRQHLYQLFHYLNHWNHFGSGYKSSTMGTIRKLVGKLPHS